MKKISTKIFLVIGGCASVAVLLLGFLILSNVKVLFRQEAEDKLVWMARSYAEQFSQEFLIIEDQVEEIAVHLQSTIDTEKLYSDPEYLAQYEQELAEFLYIFARDRTQGTAAWCYFNPELSEEPHDVYYADGNKDKIPERQEHIPFSYYDDTPTETDDKYWWYGPAKTGKLCWTNPYEWSLAQGDIIKVSSCARPVIIDDKLIAVVGTYYHFENLSQDVNKIQAYESGYATLLNEKLDFIVHPSYTTGTRNNSENLANTIDAGCDKVVTDVLNNEFGLTSFKVKTEKLLAYSHLSNGWILAIVPPLDEVYTGISLLQNILLVAVAFCIVMSLIVAWGMGKLIARPILKITDACQMLGAGTLDKRLELKTNDETMLLANSFNQMADNLEGLNSELTQLAYYDPLTKLPNKHFIEKEARELLITKPMQYAYVLFDISKFKLINDLFGLDQGDALLIHISKVFSDGIGENELCARINADHFNLLLVYENASLMEERLHELGVKICSYEFDLYPEYKMSIGFGVYVVENRHMSISIMGDKATLALEKVKGHHNLSVHFYNESLLNQIIEEQEIKNNMESALQCGEFKLYLQPKYDIQKKVIVGAEALARWVTPDRGILAPAVFIPVFEKNGFIVELDLYMLEEVCKFIRYRMDEGLPVFPISINQSRQYLNRSSYLSSLLNIALKYNVPHHLLELEITETAFFENQDEMVLIIKKLSDLGFLVSMDDFGSGYSSLNMLQDIMVDVLKLDRIFFRDSINTQRGQKIVDNIISMANDLGITVVAEGIETQDQVDFLCNTHCNIIQGYFFSRPMPHDEFEKRLKDFIV